MTGKYLLTGSAGFIGSSIAKRLIDDGHEVVGLDNLSTGKITNHHPDMEFVEGDIADKEIFPELAKHKFDGILHLAAQTSGEISYYEPDRDIKSNGLGTLNLLNFAVENGISRFIYTSSMSVYGEVPDRPIGLEHPPEPLSYYGITKLTGEGYMRAFSDRLNTTSFRLFNVYGPGQNLENMRQGMVSIYLSYLMKGGAVLVKGDIDRFRDFVYIDDVVDAYLSALNDERTFGQTFNIGTGRKTTVKELLESLCMAWGDPDRVIEVTGGTPKDQFGIYADLSATFEKLDWKPKIKLEDGLKRFADWAKGLN